MLSFDGRSISRGVRCNRLVLRLLILVSMLVSYGCCSIVSQEEIFSIKENETLDSVKKRFGLGLRHHFTVHRYGYEWRMYRCFMGYNDPVIDILFKDGRFCKYVDIHSIKFKTEKRCQDDSVSNQKLIRPWHPSDYTYVDQMLNSCIGGLELEEMLKPRSLKDTSLSVIPAAMVVAPLIVIEAPIRYVVILRHRKAIKRLDGGLFNLGESMTSVSQRLGPPLTVKEYNNGLMIWTYAYLDGRNRLSCFQTSPRLVFVFRCEKVEAIYNSGLWSRRWLASPSWWLPDA